MALRPTEQQHADAPGLQSLAPSVALGHLFTAQTAAAACVGAALEQIEAAAGLAAETIRREHRLGYSGAGSSGLMALADCLELLGTYGIPTVQTPMLFAGGAQALLDMQGAVEDDPALAHSDFAASGLGSGDTVICVSASGSTPYTLIIARAARVAGVRIIGIANVADAPLFALSDVAILLDTGPEIVAGSTRMGAGTAQKIALNMISTGMALLLGHVQDGYMVNLVADNAKLKARATGIVAQVSGTDAARAAVALDLASGRVKTAILIAAGANSLNAARDLLDASGGHLDPALASLRRRSS